MYVRLFVYVSFCLYSSAHTPLGICLVKEPVILRVKRVESRCVLAEWPVAKSLARFLQTLLRSLHNILCVRLTLLQALLRFLNCAYN